MKKFTIEVSREVSREIIVEAHDEDEATSLVWDAIDKGEITVVPEAGELTITNDDRVYDAQECDDDYDPGEAEIVSPLHWYAEIKEKESGKTAYVDEDADIAEDITWFDTQEHAEARLKAFLKANPSYGGDDFETKVSE